MHWLIQYFRDADPARKAEYDECLRLNLDHPSIEKIHDLGETEGDLPSEEFNSREKYHRHELGGRLTYQDAFDYAARELPGEWVAVSNLDIFLPPQFEAKKLESVDPKTILCLSRLEYDPKSGEATLDPGMARWASAFTQDVWVFKAPVTVEGCDFALGTIGCDVAIADRIRRSGYLPINDSQRFPVIHYDVCRGKTGDNAIAIQLQTQPDQQTFPHEAGQWLLPSRPAGGGLSLDAAANSVGLSEDERYEVACSIINRKKRLIVNRGSA